MISDLQIYLRALFDRITRHDIVLHQRGVALVEFAIIANILIIINIIIYDLTSYFRHAERARHATQFAHTVLVNDTDHRISMSDLQRAADHVRTVLDVPDFDTKNSVIVTNAIPFFAGASQGWVFVVCWSWSSNPVVREAWPAGSILPQSDFDISPWIPANGRVANSALLMLEARLTNTYLFDISVAPKQRDVSMIGPIRYAPTTPVNLYLSQNPGGAIQNDTTIRDRNAGNAVLCLR